MTEITAKIIADSVNPAADRLTTFVATYPLATTHAHVLTHRAFSRSTASQRAIPVAKMAEQVRTDPAMPYRWGKAKSGMGADEYFTNEAATDELNYQWRYSARATAMDSLGFSESGVAKEIANRLTMAFQWTTCIISATNWTGFFQQRVNKAAQPETKRLAHLMLRAYVASTPVKKRFGEWHVPFGDQMPERINCHTARKVAVARCARVSYLTHDGETDIEKDLVLFDRLVDNEHWSPFEHVASATTDETNTNFKGWWQLRKFKEIDKQFNAAKHLAAYEAELAGAKQED